MKPRVPYATVAELRKAQREADLIIGATKAYISRNLTPLVERLDRQLAFIQDAERRLLVLESRSGIKDIPDLMGPDEVPT